MCYLHMASQNGIITKTDYNQQSFFCKILKTKLKTTTNWKLKFVLISQKDGALFFMLCCGNSITWTFVHGYHKIKLFYIKILWFVRIRCTHVAYSYYGYCMIKWSFLYYMWWGYIMIKWSYYIMLWIWKFFITYSEVIS